MLRGPKSAKKGSYTWRAQAGARESAALWLSGRQAQLSVRSRAWRLLLALPRCMAAAPARCPRRSRRRRRPGRCVGAALELRARRSRNATVSKSGRRVRQRRLACRAEGPGGRGWWGAARRGPASRPGSLTSRRPGRGAADATTGGGLDGQVDAVASAGSRRRRLPPPERAGSRVLTSACSSRAPRQPGWPAPARPCPPCSLRRRWSQHQRSGTARFSRLVPVGQPRCFTPVPLATARAFAAAAPPRLPAVAGSRARIAVLTSSRRARRATPSPRQVCRSSLCSQAAGDGGRHS